MAHEPHAPAQSTFSDAEVAHFWSEDRRMATTIVCLLSGVFTIGIFLYLGVCYYVDKEPQKNPTIEIATPAARPSH